MSYVSANNKGGLTIGPHRRAEIGPMSLNLESEAHSGGSCLILSLTFLLRHFFLLPACAGQVSSYKPKATCERHRCHLFLEFARLTLLDTAAPATNMVNENLYQPALSQQLLFLFSQVLTSCFHFTKADSFLCNTL